MAIFPDSYQESRQRFQNLARQKNWRVETLVMRQTGPEGEELAIDVAFSPNEQADRRLVISSGIHGVEGFFGAAVQFAALDEWIDELPDHVSCLFIHAVNPFGYAHLRRFNEENVDPNRNFLFGDHEFSGAPDGFAKLDSFLNPKRPPNPLEPFYLMSLWKIWRHGLPALKQAIASGQYEYPQGLFFGGKEPSQSYQLLESRFRDWFAGVERVVHLDFHTGLGKWGECNLLLENALTRSREEFLKSQFGEGSYQELATDGVAYDAKGGFGGWCHRETGVRDYLFACAEFGTYGPVKVLRGLRAENQAHHWGEPNSTSTRNAKLELKELFCPASPGWRETVLNRSRELVVKSIESLGQ